MAAIFRSLMNGEVLLALKNPIAGKEALSPVQPMPPIKMMMVVIALRSSSKNHSAMTSLAVSMESQLESRLRK